MIRRTVLFSGRVQGVGFRYTACRAAASFRVTGAVRNLTDGRVEAVVEGEEAEIEQFVRAVSDEMEGYIRETEYQDGAPTGEYAGFGVRF